MIALQDLSKAYLTPQGPFFALQNINLKISAGEIFGIIGKSGAGKSTLIRCMNLLERPSSGHVYLDQKDLTTMGTTELRHARHQMGMIFQHFNLLMLKTVTENVALPLQLIGASKIEIATQVKRLLDFVGLTNKANSYPAKLSGGQKQRVAIARALACQPKILLCDEATSALDSQTTSTILELLRQINQEFNLTIVLITHEISVIKDICHRVAVLEQGQIVEEQKILDFFTNPQSESAKELLHYSPKELPRELLDRLSDKPEANSMPLVRLYFLGEMAAEPVISYLIKNMGIELNILQANINYVGQQTVGTMLIEIMQTNGQLPKALEYLRNMNIRVQELGYVT